MLKRKRDEPEVPCSKKVETINDTSLPQIDINICSQATITEATPKVKSSNSFTTPSSSINEKEFDIQPSEHDLFESQHQKKEVYKDELEENNNLDMETKETESLPNPSISLSSFHKESRFGIEEYIMENYEGFSGIIKNRSSDFMVNEINLEGKVVLSNDTSLSSYFNIEEIEMQKQTFKESEKKTILDIQAFLNALSIEMQCNPEEEKEFFEKLATYLSTRSSDSLTSSNEDSPFSITTKTSYPEKKLRSKIHLFLKPYSSILESDTVELHIRIRQASKKPYRSNGLQNSKRQKLNSKAWRSYFPDEDYVLFHLHKENLDTMEAIRQLSHSLHVPESSFSFAGTKDKRAITVQQCTVFRVPPSWLLKLSLPNIKCSDFQLVKEPLKLGDLQGNQFTIRLRHVQLPSTTHLDQVIPKLNTKGVLNYFGMQRFGTGSVSSDQIGLALLLQDYEKAMHLIMAPRVGDSPLCAQARLYFSEHKDSTPFTMFPKYAHAERAILRALPCSSKQAIQAIPIKLRTMYVHAYQSLIWNQIASARIRMSQHVLPGDIVKGNAEVTLKNVKNWTLSDILIALPGHSVIYPSNLKHLYKEYLERDGLSLDTFQLSSEWLLRLPGGYRPLIVHPSNICFNWISLDEINTTDTMDSNTNSSIETVSKNTEMNQKETSHLNVELNKDDTEIKEKILELRFELPSSSYATMVLRELMRLETSSSAHALRSQAFIPKAIE